MSADHSRSATLRTSGSDRFGHRPATWRDPESQPRRSADGGAVTAFVAVVSLAAVLTVALVVDGGRLLTARRDAQQAAAAAARVAVQQIDPAALREGRTHVVPWAARAAAARHLAATPMTGRVSTTADTATVTVERHVTMLLLGIVRIDRRTVTATATVRAVPGIDEGAP